MINTLFLDPLPILEQAVVQQQKVSKLQVKLINLITSEIDKTGAKCIINRGYYTVVRRYEFYVRVARTISHE